MKSEIKIQSELFKTIWNKYPETRRCLFHVPNGGLRRKIEASQLKASGVVAGIPDLILLWKGKAYGLELKTEKGVISQDQKKVHEAWEKNGTPVFVARSVEEGLSIVESIIFN